MPTQSRKKQTTTETPPDTTTRSTTKTKFVLVMTDTFRATARRGFVVPKELSREIDAREVTKDGYLRNGVKIPPEYFKIKLETTKRSEERTEEELSWADIVKAIQYRR